MYAPTYGYGPGNNSPQPPPFNPNNGASPQQQQQQRYNQQQLQQPGQQPQHMMYNPAQYGIGRQPSPYGATSGRPGLPQGMGGNNNAGGMGTMQHNGMAQIGGAGGAGGGAAAAATGSGSGSVESESGSASGMLHTGSPSSSPIETIHCGSGLKAAPVATVPIIRTSDTVQQPAASRRSSEKAGLSTLHQSYSRYGTSTSQSVAVLEQPAGR